MRRISITLALLLVVGVALSSGSAAARSSSGSSAGQVVMSVTGSAPKGAKVIWGTFRSGTRSAKFPFHKSIPVFEAQYSYFVSATLKHGGKITCKLTIGTATQIGHAKGGRKTCTARLTSDNKGGWQ
jgi:hypothetical protein